MKITRDNYESYFMDYLDGNLEESLTDEFIDFLENNPGLKAELQLAGPMEMEPEDISFQRKDKLYREKYDREDEFDRTAIARMEADLTESEEADFELYLSRHPEKQKAAAAFQQTKLKPDTTVVFLPKKRLYRPASGRTILLWSTRAAAVLVIGFLAYRYVHNTQPENTITDNHPAFTEILPEARVPVTVEPEKNGEKEPEFRSEDESGTVVSTKEKTGRFPVKNQREIPSKPLKKEAIAKAKIPVEVPGKLTPKDASLTAVPQEVALARVQITLPPEIKQKNEEKLLAEIVKEKTRLGNLSLTKVARAGLSLISSVSKKNFTYETNSEGDITEVNYDSRLLAFSIPTKNK